MFSVRDRARSMIRRASARFRSVFDGVESLHCFSAGGYYDPGRVSFGSLIGMDEHRVDPGAGFDWHAHRGVQIASWILDGRLRHEDSNGEARVVGPGELLVQSTGDGIRHRETNASDTDRLRFVQLTLLADAEPSVRTDRLPTTLAGVDLSLRHTSFDSLRLPAFAVVLSGQFHTEFRTEGGVAVIGAGDWLEIEGGRRVTVEGRGELLVLEFRALP
ncbi:MAG: pirin family protein [Jatrophihabitantaceae bacterium]